MMAIAPAPCHIDAKAQIGVNPFVAGVYITVIYTQYQFDFTLP